MNKARYLLTGALMIVGLIVGAVSGRIVSVVPTHAQRPDRTRELSSKWEYCSLTKAVVPSSRGGLYWISYFRETGVHVVEVEEVATERSGPAKALARLGEEGWEMVGQGQLEIRQGGFNALYFKRPKQ
ncbi:MAG TPA: hypothetical protein VF553_19030 [Pyrinomonadaceae bacterium]|jgi:hypothetical protein